MKKWVLILISLVLLILDNSLIPFLAIKGAYPSLLFVFAIAYSIINGRSEAVVIGVISGLMQDIFFYNGFGINALINMLICLIAAIIGENIYREKKLIPVISVILLYLLKILAVFTIFKLMGRSINIQVGMFTALYSSVVMFLGYDFVLRIYNIEYKKRSWRFK
ncbi:rod shape-determining protein MreD [Clostridium tertium]|jgi:rod shape-determining protein MreD|uniref:Rod shape-determining protein MreD n=1 Tax=Clostridium tertium TaxID=1559 RepID=A0A9X3XN18_9CLOT|nr:MULTISPECIES: rod shape-determining protein MreD [Clostridium]EEH99177.1 rod shape-determining protein MreD [Clostridium sp. 7_2_43FAA]MBU6136751.1 rod shape-determining protein MreD [Clostridium tertium]MDB1939547.1 rod shape-determining protein MreD [Clostridium tertium]MDB1947294.1 rod shape-determining protein MreD [Clostridium tertium]MDB1955606.1 rod shape-determining protein MreD [Clostridium tertium]